MHGLKFTLYLWGGKIKLLGDEPLPCHFVNQQSHTDWTGLSWKWSSAKQEANIKLPKLWHSWYIQLTIIYECV